MWVAVEMLQSNGCVPTITPGYDYFQVAKEEVRQVSTGQSQPSPTWLTSPGHLSADNAQNNLGCSWLEPCLMLFQGEKVFKDNPPILWLIASRLRQPFIWWRPPAREAVTREQWLLETLVKRRNNSLVGHWNIGLLGLFTNENFWTLYICIWSKSIWYNKTKMKSIGVVTVNKKLLNWLQLINDWKGDSVKIYISAWFRVRSIENAWFLAIFSCPVTRPDLWWDFWPRDKRGEPHMVPRLRGGFHAPNWISSQALDLQFIYILLQVSISSWHWHRSLANINLHIWFAIESKTRIKILLLILFLSLTRCWFWAPVSSYDLTGTIITSSFLCWRH